MALEQQQFQQLVSLLQQRQKLGQVKPTKPLSGEASKLIGITKTVQPEIEKLKSAFQENYRKSLIGITTGTDRRLVKLVDNVADKIGRLRSGGAINKEEEARFKRQIASFKDIPFGRREDAIAALDGYLSEAQSVAQSIQPTTVSGLQLPPELQAYVQQRRSGARPGALPTTLPDAVPGGAPEISAVLPTEPIRTPLEKVTDIITSIFPGAKIGEAIQTGRARRIAQREFGVSQEQAKEFLPGIKPREIAGELGEIALTVAGGPILGKLGAGIGRVAGKGAGKLAQVLEEANLRLSPVQKANLGKKLKQITDYTSKLTGGPKQRLVQARREIDLDEGKIQRFLKTTAAKKSVSKNSVINDLEALKGKYADDRDVLAIEKQIDSVIQLFKTRMPSRISLTKLNQFKRTTFKNAFNKAGDKVMDAVEFDIADVAKNSIEKAVKGLRIDGKDIGSFNRIFGNKIEAAKLLKTATGRAEIGFTGKIVGALAGGSIGAAVGGPGGAAVGAVLGPTIGKKIAGTAVRGRIGRVLRRISR